MRKSTFRWLLGWWIIWGTSAFGAIPLADHPPQLAQLTPPLYPLEYASAQNRQAFTVGVYVAADGALSSIDTGTLPPPLVQPVEHAIQQSLFRPAKRGSNTATAGYQRVLLKAYFTPVNGVPTPTPQLHFDEAARDKLDAIARTIVRGWLRIRLSVNAKGEIQRVETQNRGLDTALSTFFSLDVPAHPAPFAPARADGRDIAGQIDLFWDLTPLQDRVDYEAVPAELVTMGANPLPSTVQRLDESRSYRAWIIPHRSNRVIGAIADPDMPKSHATAFLQRASSWFIPDRNTGTPLEVSLSYTPDSHSLEIHSFRPIEIFLPSLRHSARPEYPRRRLLPNPEGFVRVAMTIGTDGRPMDVEVLEVSAERFRQPALEALAYWHFTPMQVDGASVASRIFWTIRLDPTAR